MDYQNSPPFLDLLENQNGLTVNPADLQMGDSIFPVAPASYPLGLPLSDSAVDLPNMAVSKNETNVNSIWGANRASTDANSSPGTDNMVFSSANSPNSFFRESSQNSFQQNNDDNATDDVKFGSGSPFRREMADYPFDQQVADHIQFETPTMRFDTQPRTTQREMQPPTTRRKSDQPGVQYQNDSITIPHHDGLAIPQDDAITIPQNDSTAGSHRQVPIRVFVKPDKFKTRAETQIKVTLTMSPPPKNSAYMRFPKRALAKPKLMASEDERSNMHSIGYINMKIYVVCATAVDNKADMQVAMKRARGETKSFRRPKGKALAELDKDDPAHPQNGGEVVICEGCKERERKRYDRKKKKGDDESEWWGYEDERVVMINEKEFKKFQDVEGEDVEGAQFSGPCKQVEFAMRIACYCRHQEEKTPLGYRVIFTFTDEKDNLVAQHASQILQITDDHKNKEVVGQDVPDGHDAGVYYTQAQEYNQMAGSTMYPSGWPPNGLPMYSQSQPPLNANGAFSVAPMSAAAAQFSQPQTPISGNGTFSCPPISAAAAQFSQPQTPINGNGAFSAPPISPAAAQFSQPTTPTGHHPQNPANGFTDLNGFNAPSAPTATNGFTPANLLPNRGLQSRPQPLQTLYTSYSQTNLYSPGPQLSPTGLYRPQSVDSFPNFNSALNFNYESFASAPQSVSSTPINLSRPASPSWEQGPVASKRQSRRGGAIFTFQDPSEMGHAQYFDDYSDMQPAQ